ncbi:MFS transporter [Candidatus Clostridium radicumherbarum]|uniref:MFS transporter n=1 Tax=Candidatus Clostridium radicumherbarum TaxID=3381662 RepID=A0ABW8TPF0_9CLOT
MVKELFKKRESFNSLMFIILYCFIGVLNGVLFDVLMTFLQLTSSEIANSFSSFLGIASFIGACLIFLVPKTGYKKLMLLGPIVAAASLLIIIFSNEVFIKSISVLLLITGLTLFDVILGPYLSSYTNASNRTLYFTAAFYTNVVGCLLGTLTGGPLIVSFFAKKLNIAFEAAKVLTSKVSSLSFMQRTVYIEAHKNVLIFFVFILVISIIPILLIRESKEDYRKIQQEEKTKFNINAFFSKSALIFLAYMIICKIAVSLIVPYVSIYLGTLGINRASISFIMTAQYFAILLIMPFAPYLIKKLGQINMLAWCCLAAVPFMFIIGYGGIPGMSVVAVISASLFFRSGLINATSPVFSSLPMELVDKEYRPAYSSIIFISQGIAQTITGLFAKNMLFSNNLGYGKAYFIAGVLFAAAQLILLTNFRSLNVNILTGSKQRETSTDC